MDLISRQDAIDALCGEPLPYTEYEQGLHDKWMEKLAITQKKSCNKNKKIATYCNLLQLIATYGKENRWTI